MATLVAKVRSITGSDTTVTSNAEVVEFLSDGYDYILNQVPVAKLAYAGVDSTNITGSTGYDITHSHILSVRRNGFTCVQIPEDMVYSQSNQLGTESLFQATNIFPVFYVRTGLVYIKPDPTAGSPGKVTKLDFPTLTSSTTSTVYRELDAVAVLYAAGLDSYAQSGYWSSKYAADLDNASGDFRGALNKAKVLIDDSTSLSQGQDVEYYIQNEDTEMMSGIVQVARQEVERAMAEIQNGNLTNQITQQFIMRARDLFTQADNRLGFMLRGYNGPTGNNGESGQ